MVVVASVGLIMTSIVGIILGSFRAKNKNILNNKIMENGGWIISELRKNVFNSTSSDIVCEGEGKSVQIKNINDGELTILACDLPTNQIASISAARTMSLNNKEVTIINCDTFVTCDTDNDGGVTGLTFNFGISSTFSGIGSSQVFTTKITLRN